MAQFNERQQRQLWEAVQHLAQSKHHLSLAIVGLEQALEILKLFKQNLAPFQTMITHLNTFITKLTQAHDSIERNLPQQARQPKFMVNKDDAKLDSPWLTPARIFWIAVAVWGFAMVIWFARYVGQGMYGP
jgi:hypothetical protein